MQIYSCGLRSSLSCQEEMLVFSCLLGLTSQLPCQLAYWWWGDRGCCSQSTPRCWTGAGEAGEAHWLLYLPRWKSPENDKIWFYLGAVWWNCATCIRHFRHVSYPYSPETNRWPLQLWNNEKRKSFSWFIERYIRCSEIQFGEVAPGSAHIQLKDRVILFLGDQKPNQK